jgi:uncharacterized protein YidB (DUF937 family)
MGTSTSSAGAGAGSPFDPPWLDAAGEGIDDSNADAPLQPSVDGDEGNDESSADGNDDSSTEPVNGEAPQRADLAPAGRYKDARTQLSRFMRTGDQGDARRAVGSLVNKGMGGATRAASRMRTSVAAASALGGFLAMARDGTNPSINDWVTAARQRGLSAQDIALEVIQKLTPAGGSVDEESAKHAMSQAIVYLYEVNPAIDIFALSDEQISSLMGYTVAFDVYNRVQLELGRVFEKLKYTAQLVHERLAQLQDYILVVVRDAINKVTASGRVMSANEISNSALRSALDVFGTP